MSERPPMRIAHVIHSLSPDHGGPSRTTRSLAQAQAAKGEAVELLTTGSGEHLLHDGAYAERTFPGGWPARLGISRGLRAHLADTRSDVVHAHGIWQRPLHYAHLAAVRHDAPLVISPRGMLNGWALGHHRWRKRLARVLVHPHAFHSAAGWHATSAEEALDIRRQGFMQPVCVAPNGVTLPNDGSLAEARTFWRREEPALRDRPVALFYARLHRMKRVRELIELWAARPTGDWLLLVAGIPEEYAIEELRALAARLGASDKIVVHDGRRRPPPYGAANLFLLPSQAESFGLVIAEAMAARVPVVVTDTTPWSRLARDGSGWCVPWDEYPDALAAALAFGPERLAVLGSEARKWMERDFSWEQSAARLLEFYRHFHA